MTHMPRTHALLRLTCAAGAALITAVIGLSIQVLARHYDEPAAVLAAAQPAVVAQAQPR
jgi:hypothetical protein